VLRRSNSTTSRQRPSGICPMRSLTPRRWKPQASCSAIEAAFSGKMPALSVQKPARSAASMSPPSSARPTPRRVCAGAT